ncbi:hypothetical protein BJX64DRAFT_300218 [Aspergillus heterothallicus]
MTEESAFLIGRSPGPGNGSSFQVTIDAGAAASGVINFSANALARLSHAGIDPSAFRVCIVAGNAVSCSPVGLERFYTALSSAPVHAGFQKMLWFGFGHQSPIQILTATESGCKFAALSACLAEVYSVDMAASIMLEFSRKAIGEKATTELSDTWQKALPSQLQMNSLVRKCACIFSTSNFPLWAEHYMSFDRQPMVRGRDWAAASGQTHRPRRVASPSDVASALHAVMGIYAGSTKHLTLIGVADAALVAAIAVWLLELRVALYTSEKQRDEDIYFRNFDDEQDAQLTVIYSRQPQKCALVQRDRTIQIPDAAVLFKPQPELYPSQEYATFGSSMRTLLASRRHAFAQALGSAARILAARNGGDPDIPQEHFGVDFVHFAGRRFPELADIVIQEKMLSAANATSYKDACTALARSLGNLNSRCSCATCCKLCHRPSGAEHHVHFAYCLVGLTVTIVKLVQGLSGINPVDGLYPSRKGLEYVYFLHLDQLEWDLHSINPQGNMPPIVLSSIMFDIPPLVFARDVFRGIHYDSSSEEAGTSAIASDGLCLYLDILRSPLSDDPATLGRVNVIPGEIQLEGRVYPRILDNSPPDIARRYRPTEITLNVLTAARDKQPSLQVLFEIKETTTRLAMVGPSTIVQNINRGLGMIYCRNDGCEDTKVLAGNVGHIVGDRLAQTLTVGNSKVYLFDDSPLSRLVVAAYCQSPLLQRRECLACSVAAGLRHGWGGYAVLCRLHTPAKQVLSRVAT